MIITITITCEEKKNSTVFKYLNVFFIYLFNHSSNRDHIVMSLLFSKSKTTDNYLNLMSNCQCTIQKLQV